MSVSDRKASLKLDVKNFGPIVEATVDLRSFTLFVGPSNTGKSYLAIMTYALHRIFGSSTGAIGSRYRVFGRYPYPRNRAGKTIPKSAVGDLIDWSRQAFQEKGKKKKSDKLSRPLPEGIVSYIREVMFSIDDRNMSIESEISRCFGLQSMSQLTRTRGTQGAQVVLKRYVGSGEKNEDPFEYKIDVSRQGRTRFSASLPEGKPLYPVGDFGRILGPISRLVKSEDDELIRFMISGLVDAVFPYIVGPLSAPAYYLPADRTGVMHAHRVVVNALIERATTAGIHPTSPMPMLSGVLADFLGQLIELSDLRPRKLGANLAARLEKKILDGSVLHEGGRNSEISYPSFFYQPNGWKESLSLMRASSMVSELAPVVLYLRYVVRPGDVLIIEEPESHLHPAMQVEFTRLLGAAVRNGIRIIMTTHSEWVLEELANLVRLSELPQAERKTIGGGDVALEAHEVGAWLFEHKLRPRGSVVREIPLDSEAGTFAAGYEDVAAALHNRWADISSRSQKGERR